jgi:hypothetical protein
MDKVSMNTETTLSDNAQLIIDGYWTLCSGGEAVEAAIGDYLSRTSDPEMLPWSFDGERPATPYDFMEAIMEVIAYFRLKGEVM